VKINPSITGELTMSSGMNSGRRTTTSTVSNNNTQNTSFFEKYKIQMIIAAIAILGIIIYKIHRKNRLEKLVLKKK